MKLNYVNDKFSQQKQQQNQQQVDHMNSRHNQSQHSSMGGGQKSQQMSQGPEHHYSAASQVLHEAIIDLYLQVKVRSNDEVSTFNLNSKILHK